MAVPDSKKKVVADIVKLAKAYPIIGSVNMENLPAPQLNVMRAQLRGKVEIYMTKRRLMNIALEQLKAEKPGIEALSKHLTGMPALIFTKDSPFKLSKTLRKSKSSAPAKAGQTSPRDIIIPKGPTPFAPGPIISELSSVGIKTGVEGGKVAVKQDSLIVKEGEKIKPKVAEVLTRLGIQPMEVGLDLTAAYEKGIIYDRAILSVDEAQYIANLEKAARESFNLAFSAAYATKDNAALLIGKAFNDAKALGLSQNIMASGLIADILGKAERAMLSLKATANITDAPAEAPKAEEAKPEPKTEESQSKPEEKPADKS